MNSTARRLRTFLAQLLLVPIVASSDLPDQMEPPPLDGRVPVRPPDALTGSQFAAMTAGWRAHRRQEAAVAQLLSGNLPAFLRVPKPVRISGTTASGVPLVVTIFVLPDYVSIGSDEDYLRIPLTLPSALTVADSLGFILPTRKIVDAVYEQATCRLQPEPLPPGPFMRSIEYFLRHRDMIRAQLAKKGCKPGELTAGHKKDIVISNRLRAKPGRIAIYGWHMLTGKAIQPLSTVHDAEYADYSHGVRLVDRTVWIGGVSHSILDVLQDPDLAPLLTYEGEIPDLDALLHVASTAGP